MTTLFSSTTPITASPTVSLDEDENIWVYFGTGKYYNNDDKNDNSTQYFYGIKDSCAYGVCGVSDEVALADLYNSTSIVILSNGEVENATAHTWNAFVDEVQAEKGWYIDLAAGGERLLTRPNILGGVVLFAPYTPLEDICQCGGTGALYALYYETGTAYHKPIIGTSDYGDGRDECLKAISLGEGLTSEIGLHVGRKAESTGFIQQGTGAVKQVEIGPALNIRSGIIGWMQH
jgi:type IV pilus assembly protein PilY1